MKRKPFADFRVESIEEADVILLGVPFDGGASAGRGAPCPVSGNLDDTVPGLFSRGLHCFQYPPGLIFEARFLFCPGRILVPEAEAMVHHLLRRSL